MIAGADFQALVTVGAAVLEPWIPLVEHERWWVCGPRDSQLGESHLIRQNSQN